MCKIVVSGLKLMALCLLATSVSFAQTAYTWVGGSTALTDNANWGNAGGDSPFRGGTANGPATLIFPAGSGVATNAGTTRFNNVNLTIDGGQITVGDPTAVPAHSGEKDIYFNEGTTVTLNGPKTLTAEQIADPSTVPSSLIATHYFTVGSDGSGTITINGGYAQSKHLRLGYGNVATLNLTGGYYKVISGANIGYGSGTGIANVSGGTWEIGTLNLGESETTTGTLNLYGGTIKTNDMDTRSGTGTINVYGGKIESTRRIGVAAGANGVGTMNVYGDTTLKADTAVLLCAFGIGSTGRLNLYSGDVALTTGNFGIGWNNSDGTYDAAVNVMGADVAVSANTTMGYASESGASSQINVSSGSITFTGAVILGNSNFNGTPQITLSGGKMVVNGSFSGNSNGWINFVLGENGFGELECTGNFDSYGGKFYIGVDHGTSAIANYDPDGYTINAPAAVLNPASVEKLVVSDLLEKSGEKYLLKAAKNANGGAPLMLDGRALELTGDFQTSGWVEVAGADSNPFVMKLDLDLDLAEGVEADNVVDWFAQNINTSASLDGDTLTLFYDPMNVKAFAWDFSQMPALGDVRLTALSGQAVPEPSAWLLLVLSWGGGGTLG